MEKLDENEMINRILRFYAGQNMEYQQTFRQTIDSFQLRDQFVHPDQEIELLKQRMMDYNLLRSKNKRLIVTNHGRDIVFNDGGWLRYLERIKKENKNQFWMLKVEVWSPILISVFVFVFSIYQDSDLRQRVLQLEKTNGQQQDQINELNESVIQKLLIISKTDTIKQKMK